MKGYWKKPEETANQFVGDFLRTGDVGIMDEDGFIFIVDRIKDLIICSGYNVYPRRIEEAIYEHPAVEEVTVIGIKDDYRGEAPKAFVKLSAGATATEDDIRKHLEAKISKIEMPAEIEFRDALPKTMIGKLSKKELKAEEEARRKAKAQMSSRRHAQAPGECLPRLAGRGGPARLYTIGELGRRAWQVTTRTIRFYEAKGLIAPARRGVQRSYSRRDRARLRLILRGKNLGFSLEEIAQYLKLYDADPAHIAQTQMLLAGIEEAIEDLQAKRADLDRTLKELKEIRGQCVEHLSGKDGPGRAPLILPNAGAVPPGNSVPRAGMVNIPHQRRGNRHEQDRDRLGRSGSATRNIRTRRLTALWTATRDDASDIAGLHCAA